MIKLIRSLVAILVVTVLIGAPAVQAMFAVPCQNVVMSATDQQLSSAQPPASTPAPCKGMMPGCADMLGCGIDASLPVQVPTAAHRLIWTSLSYQANADWHEGLSEPPYVGPPITI
jgi:hypothetical protein